MPYQIEIPVGMREHAQAVLLNGTRTVVHHPSVNQLNDMKHLRGDQSHHRLAHHRLALIRALHRYTNDNGTTLKIGRHEQTSISGIS